MAIVVHAGALSHSPLANHQEPPEDTRAVASYRAGVTKLREEIHASRPDVVIAIGPDHFRSLFYDNMPAYIIGVGRTYGFGDWGTTNGELKAHHPFARYLLRTVMNQGFEPANSHELVVDHGLTQALDLLGLSELPVVPIIINAAAPPLALPKRCNEFGLAIGKAVADYPEDLRVVVIGSGGLSHTVPMPSIGSEPMTQERAAKLIYGKATAQAEEPAREAALLSTVTQWLGGINAAWDRDLLRAFEHGEAGQLAATLTEDAIREHGGNGAQEVRCWLAAIGATGNAAFRTLSYEPIPFYITGMGVIARA